MKIQNMTSNNTGKAIANQFQINTSKYVAFQSYDSMIAAIVHKTGKTAIDSNYWDYSVTTGKYRNQFLGENKAATQKKIASGEYILVGNLAEFLDNL